MFKVYIDDDPNPVCTITPKNYVENEETHYQADFQWEHRYKAAAPYHSDDTQPETGVPYTEATLNGCAPHNYRVSMTGTTNSRTTKTNTT